MYKMKYKLFPIAYKDYSILMKIVCTQGKGTNSEVRAALRAPRFSIAGVKLSNGPRIALRNCKNIFAFQKMHKTSILDRYKRDILF